MTELTIEEMIRRVPEGEKRIFEPTRTDPVEERFFEVRQNWDYSPGRITWHNWPSGQTKPWFGTRIKPRIPVSMLAPPDVTFKGSSKDVVDFYSTGNDAFFLSPRLVELIEDVDPGSLEHVAFSIRAKDAELPFHAVMPRRVIAAIDPQRTVVAVESEDRGGWYLMSVQFPDGIVFDNGTLQDAASFSDIDAPGWYWSKDLIELAKKRGIRGLFAESVFTRYHQFARL